jgi:glycerol transport system ATP-binding protein
MTQGLELHDIACVVKAELHLSGISMSFLPGSFTTLLGRTRAGKTTLLRVLAGLDQPSMGRIAWHGRDVTRVSVQQRDVAMVYQQFVNYPSLSVYENIASPLRVQGKLSRSEIDKRVRDTAALLRIDRLLDRLPAEISGGQQQRTAIARALVKRAGLLLLDEPLANLDYKLREELRSELRSLFRETQAVVVYATAEPSEALLLGGTTAVLHEGRLLQHGPTLDLYRAPDSERVGQVFSDPQMSVFEAELSEAREVRVGDALRFPAPASLAALAPSRYRFGVRAHHVRLARRNDHDLRVAASVRAQEVSGSETLLYVSAAGLTLTAQLPGVHRFGLSAPVELFISPRDLFVFDAQGGLVVAAEFGARVEERGSAREQNTDAPAATPTRSHGAH